MLERIDRVQLITSDRQAAAATFARLLGTEIAREDRSAVLGARRTVLALGESELELCEPDGTGRAAEALAQRGEGLYAAGASTSDLGALRRRLVKLGLDPISDTDGEQLHLAPSPGFGVPFVLSPHRERSRVGAVSFLYEVTNTLVSPWPLAAAWYAGLFGLDPTAFSPIASARFGYQGTLTLFDPDHLHRIELSQVTDAKTAMGRWAARRGDSLYMCYVEAHDVRGICDRLEEHGDRWTPRGGSREEEREGLWIHPASLHGLLLGISRPTLAWEWSGRPDRIAPLR